MASMGEVNAAVRQARDKALHGAESAHAAGEKADEVGGHLQDLVMRLGRIIAEIGDISHQLEFEVGFPLVSSSECARTAHAGLQNASQGSTNPRLHEAVGLLGKAAEESEASKAATQGVIGGLASASDALLRAAADLRDLPGNTIGNPGDDGSNPYGVASLASLSGAHLISAVTAMDEWRGNAGVAES